MKEYYIKKSKKELDNMDFSSFYSLDSSQNEVLWYLPLIREIGPAHQCLLTNNTANEKGSQLSTCHMYLIPRNIFFTSIPRKGVTIIRQRTGDLLRFWMMIKMRKKRIHGRKRKRKRRQSLRCHSLCEH